MAASRAEATAVGLSFEKLGDGAGAGVGGGAEAALRGAAMRWLVPHGRVVLHGRALPLHLPREGFDRLSVTRTL